MWLTASGVRRDDVMTYELSTRGCCVSTNTAAALLAAGVLVECGSYGRKERLLFFCSCRNVASVAASR